MDADQRAQLKKDFLDERVRGTEFEGYFSGIALRPPEEPAFISLRVNQMAPGRILEPVQKTYNHTTGDYSVEVMPIGKVEAQ